MARQRSLLTIGVLLLAGFAQQSATAELVLPPVLTDNAVLQRDMPLPIWGWADPGERIVVQLRDQRHETAADDEGYWQVTLEPLPLGDAKPLSMQIDGENQSVSLEGLLVGDVWLCSGQSNMQWALQNSWNGYMEAAKADRPNIRLLTVNTPGTQSRTRTCDAEWQICSPETALQFSAVGYHFGLELHERFDIPIGLIDNAWGGSSCEAWTPREKLQGDPMYAALLQRWRDVEASYDATAEEAKHRERLAAWEENRRRARANGQPEPPKPRWENKLTGKHRPANIYHGRLGPIMPYAIKGVIWYQGESNAARAFQYRELFPLMIRSWREAWGQGPFPFYWVQLADFKPEVKSPAESDWAELREAQTLTLDCEPNTGQAVIIDLGEAQDIHPRNKREVALRLARLAIGDAYGVAGLPHSSPRAAKIRFDNGKAIIEFRDVGAGLRTSDVAELIGFTLAGEDRVFHSATARIVAKDRIEVVCDDEPEPVAVRYAWADNPRCNVITKAGLPLTPFRSDDWPGKTYSNR